MKIISLYFRAWMAMIVCMSKPIHYAVAVVIKNAANPNEFLVVRRPESDPDLGGNWGFPAVTLKEGELPEQGAERACREKLHCNAKATRFLGVMHQKRNGYDIALMDIEMWLDGNELPDVRTATTKNTKYTDQKWSIDPMDLMPSAQHGSCCSSIFLNDCGLLDRSAWIASLEGSGVIG